MKAFKTIVDHIERVLRGGKPEPRGQANHPVQAANTPGGDTSVEYLIEIPSERPDKPGWIAVQGCRCAYCKALVERGHNE